MIFSEYFTLNNLIYMEQVRIFKFRAEIAFNIIVGKLLNSISKLRGFYYLEVAL